MEVCQPFLLIFTCFWGPFHKNFGVGLSESARGGVYQSSSVYSALYGIQSEIFQSERPLYKHCFWTSYQILSLFKGSTVPRSTFSTLPPTNNPIRNGTQCVYQFHITSHLPCWASGEGPTNNLPHVLTMGVSRSHQHADRTLNSTELFKPKYLRCIHVL